MLDLRFSEQSLELQKRLDGFMAGQVVPRYRQWHQAVRRDGADDAPFLGELQAKARALGLWNLGLPDLAENEPGTRLSNLDFAPLAESMGRVMWAPRVFNCHAPDVPNMVVLQQYGTPAQKARWLRPLLEATERSAFAMTEPDVASSDATNISTSIRRDGDDYVINGRKWYITGAAHPDCKTLIVMGVSDPDGNGRARHSTLIVPTGTPGVEIVRPSSFLGYVEPGAPAAEIRFTNVRVPRENLLGAEGAGFEIGQARLGPARVHHCMRSIGHCEMILELMMARAGERRVFGRRLDEFDANQQAIALSRIEIEQARLLVYKTAWLLDRQGQVAARREVSMIKVCVARLYQNIVDRAIQLFGAMGGSDETPLAEAAPWARALRLFDGPDEVHLRQIFRLEPRPTVAVADSPFITR